jgi:hypothetical protein
MHPSHKSESKIMSIRPTEESLAKVGVDLRNKKPLSLKCKTCGVVWFPNIQDGDRLQGGWWKCPNDPEHTKQ